MPQIQYESFTPPGAAELCKIYGFRWFVAEFKRLESERRFLNPNVTIETLGMTLPMWVHDAFFILYAMGWGEEHLYSFHQQLFALDAFRTRYADYADYVEDNITEEVTLQWQEGLDSAAAMFSGYAPDIYIALAALPAAIFTVVSHLRMWSMRGLTLKAQDGLFRACRPATLLEPWRERSINKNVDRIEEHRSLTAADMSSSETLDESSASNTTSLSTDDSDGLTGKGLFGRALVVTVSVSVASATQTDLSCLSLSSAAGAPGTVAEKEEDTILSSTDKAIDNNYQRVPTEADDPYNHNSENDPEHVRLLLEVDAARGAVIVAKKQLALYARQHDTYGSDAYDPDGTHGLRLAGNLATVTRKPKEAHHDLESRIHSDNNDDKGEDDNDDKPMSPTLPAAAISSDKKSDDDDSSSHTTPSVLLDFYGDDEDDEDGSDSNIQKNNSSNSSSKQKPSKPTPNRRTLSMITKRGFAQNPPTETSVSFDVNTDANKVPRRRASSPVLPSFKRRKVMVSSGEAGEIRDGTVAAAATDGAGVGVGHGMKVDVEHEDEALEAM